MKQQHVLQAAAMALLQASHHAAAATTRVAAAAAAAPGCRQLLSLLQGRPHRPIQPGSSEQQEQQQRALLPDLLPAANSSHQQQAAPAPNLPAAQAGHPWAGLQQEQQQHCDQSILTAAVCQQLHLWAGFSSRMSTSGVPQPCRAYSSSSSSSSGSSSGVRRASLPCQTSLQPSDHSGSHHSSGGSSPYLLDYAHSWYPSSLGVTPPEGLAAAATAAAPAAAATTAPPPTDAAAAADPSSSPRGRVVAVAVSGGVDSAVSAMLLQRQGYQVFGVYMHNWDAADEAGAGTPTCTSEADLADAQALCKGLGIPLYEADFVSRYWTEVFETFLQGLSRGLTPNPDLACNSHIKFGALLQFARAKGADLLATGHYARLGWTAAGEWQPTLLAGADPDKDQSYFLASLTQQQLAASLFPVGHLTKAQVREVAAAAGLPQATKRSSAGICFIGRRSFGSFLETYLPPRPGVYVDASTGGVLGPCSNMLAVTVGQKAVGLGGQRTRVYVLGKDLPRGVVYVAATLSHPALYSRSVLLQAPNWVAGHPPPGLTPPSAPRTAGDDACAPRHAGEGDDAGSAGNAAAAAEAPASVRLGGSSSSSAGAWRGRLGVLQCEYQARYRQTAAKCSVRAVSAAEASAFQVSRFCSAVSPDICASAESAAAGIAAGLAAAPAASPGGVVGSGVQGEGGVRQEGSGGHGFLVAELHVPLRGIAPGQMFVMYDGEVCLGSATIVAYGPTLAERMHSSGQLKLHCMSPAAFPVDSPPGEPCTEAPSQQHSCVDDAQLMAVHG